VGRYVLLVVISFIVLFPIYTTIVAAFTPSAEFFDTPLVPDSFTLDVIRDAWTTGNLGRYLFNSIVVAVVITVFQVVSAVLAAYAFAFLRFPGKNVVFVLFIATLLVPLEATLVVNFDTIDGLGWANSYLGLSLPFLATAFGIFLMRQVFLTAGGSWGTITAGREIGVYQRQNILTDQTLFVGSSFAVELAVRGGAVIRYTLDGSEPGPDSPAYEKPIVIDGETTVKTRAFWSNGFSSLVESRTFRPAVPLAASAPVPVKRGLAFEYFEGRFDKLPDFGALSAARAGIAPRPDLAAAGDKDEFALRFKGSIRIPETGVYIFYASSDDGSKLSVAGKEIIVNDGVHGMSEEKSEIALEGGWHPFELVYFQGKGGLGLDVSWRGPGFEKTPIPAGVFGR